MTQRTLAAVLAAPLTLLLFLLAAWLPLPYATYSPGLTVDVLGENDGQEIIQVQGRKTYRDDGQLRMTTVFVSTPQSQKTLVQLMEVWVADDEAVYPYESVHEQGVTDEESRQEGLVDMVTSQDKAVAVALQELGVDVRPRVGVAQVAEDGAAQGVLEVRDLFLRVGGRPATGFEAVVDAIKATPRGEEVEVEVLRDGRRRTFSIEPRTVGGTQQIGVNIGTFFQFPFKVSVNIDPDIGGPSAGLMFSLAVYDTLTPGSLTGGANVAGTGTIAADGAVGPIGGIQQKVAGARDDGVDLFLVPEDNCEDALGADNGDMRLVRATTMHDARVAIEKWTADPEADLPRCEDVAS